MKIFSSVYFFKKTLNNVHVRRNFSSEISNRSTKLDKIRNIGILAHIDAGKTTTTERMLFYSGTIRSMGEVHHGNTVTDYMEQERQRGITITSAAVSFPWRDHQINLIDTPGHIDFTMEVEQSLAVLDGAIVVLDGSAGVEAQTLTVWRQAEGYRVPRLVYLNKMDRSDAFEDACVRSVEERLRVKPLLLHHCLRHQGRLIGLIDLVSLEEVVWTQGRGQQFTRRRLSEKEDGGLWERSVASRRDLVDALSGLDDQLADIVIQKDSLEDIEASYIKGAIQRCTVNMTAFPVLCGSSYKNIGVQTLLDAVADFLPAPAHAPSGELYRVFGSDLAARAFKVQHDSQRGVLTFFRLYGGEITRGQKIYSLGQSKTEQTGMLYVALADEYKPVEKVTAGNIAVVSGLKATMTGDLVTSSQSSASRAKARLATVLSENEMIERLAPPAARPRLQDDITPADAADILLGIGTTVPEPVFMCSIEPPSSGQMQALETALEELRREDPSLRVTSDEESGQLILAGMGELHIEIIKERIIREYKIDVELGPLQIAYREALVGKGRQRLRVERKIGGAKQEVTLELSARSGEHLFKLDRSPEAAANLAHVHPRQMKALEQGVAAAMRRGPALGCKMVDVQVTLHWLEVGRGTSDSVLSAAVVQCLRKVFEEAGTTLLEPVMSLHVVCPETHSARVLADLARRRAAVSAVGARHGDKVIECVAPLSALRGYSTALRSLSSGLATCTMQYFAHQEMPPIEQQRALEEATGYY